MFRNIDEAQKLGMGNMEVVMKSFGVMSKGFQAIAAEIANYSKSSLEEHTAAIGKTHGRKDNTNDVRGPERICEDGL
jgi:hypothetical protein